LRSMPYRDLRLRRQRFARRLIGAAWQRGPAVIPVARTWPVVMREFSGAQLCRRLAAFPFGSRRLGAKESYIEQLHRQIVAAERSACGARRPRRLRPAAAHGNDGRSRRPMARFDALPEATGRMRTLSAGDTM